MQEFYKKIWKNARVLAYMRKKLYLCTRFMSILIVIGLVGAAMLLLSVGVIFRKDHSFRSQHIHQNERMKKDKIHCAISEDALMRRKSKKAQNDPKKEIED